MFDGFKMVFVFVTGTSSSELSSEEGGRFLLLVTDELFTADTKVPLDIVFLAAGILLELDSEDELLFYKLK